VLERIYTKRDEDNVREKISKLCKKEKEMNLQENISRIKEVMGVSLEEKESGEKWIKCFNCKKKFTQTIHKGKKSLPICPHCGTNNDLVTESEIPLYIKRRLFDFLPRYVRDTYEHLVPWSFNSYDEYMSRIIFNVIREISNSSGDLNYEEILKMREKIEPYITKYVEDYFSDEIEEYYLDNMTPG
jgi:DNA-directed RNA polymerase subunit RPC12/RpoP